MERRRQAERTRSMSETQTSGRDPYRDDDIPSDLYDTSHSRFSDVSLYRRGPEGEMRTGFPWRTFFVTVLLFGIGLTFLLLGVLHFRDKDHETFIAFVSVGSLCFLPGTYLVFNLVQTMRGVAGFDMSQCMLFLVGSFVRQQTFYKQVCADGYYFLYMWSAVKLRIGMTIDGNCNMWRGIPKFIGHM